MTEWGTASTRSTSDVNASYSLGSDFTSLMITPFHSGSSSHFLHARSQSHHDAPDVLKYRCPILLFVLRTKMHYMITPSIPDRPKFLQHGIVELLQCLLFLASFKLA